LAEQIWPGQFISDATLESHLRLVRQAIGDSGRAQRLIQTLYGYGYRFIGVVVEHNAVLPVATDPTQSARVSPVTEPVPAQAMAPTGGAAPSLEQLPQPSAIQNPTEFLGPDRTPSGNRQLTVLVCYLAETTALAMRLEPETLHAVLHTYHTRCLGIMERFGGYVTQTLGDSLVVYFGWPQAHEDDARRAVQAGLTLIEAFEPGRSEVSATTVRVGVHTSLVVVGAHEPAAQLATLALGEAPQLAPQLARQAAPQTVVVSTATWRLVAGWFIGEALQDLVLSGVSQPLPVYCVLRPSGVQSALEAGGTEKLTPLMGRMAELTFLQERWTQAREGTGQVVVLSGEAGIGKSRLAEVLCAQVVAVGHPQSVLRCSPYHTHSPLHPIIAHIQRLAHWHRQDPPATRLDKLERVLREYGLALEQMVPRLAALLSVPLLERYAPVSLTPQQHKQQTYAALIAWLRAAADQQQGLLVWEDLHWADPSTLELLSLWIDQVPTLRVLTLVLYRPEFRLSWTPQAHCSQLTLNRFTRVQGEQMLGYLTRSQPLAAEVREQVLARADGVPLFLEELVKMLLESTRRPAEVEHNGQTTRRPLVAIPPTLQDALMARLDRLDSARELAQVGATWGREFTYEQIQALVALEDSTLQPRLGQLVEAEILYQRGLPPQASYRFKHALIQEAAYHALLQGTRQQYHARIAQMLSERFPETVETQPELLAHHYTEAGLLAQAIPYWQRAGERAVARAANLEAMRHLNRGLELLRTLPDTPERMDQELHLQFPLGSALAAAKGFAAPEVEQVYARTKELCQQIGATDQLFLVLGGLGNFYLNRAQLQTARELAEQRLRLAQRRQDPQLLMGAHISLGLALYHAGEFTSALVHLQQTLRLSAPEVQRTPISPGWQRIGVVSCHSHTAWTLWFLGYAEQSLAENHATLGVAKKLGHPFFLVNAFYWVAQLHQYRRDLTHTYEMAEATITLSSAQDFAQQIGQGLFLRGWALAMQGQAAAGLAQMREGFAAWEATGAEVLRPYYLALLAEVLAHAGQPDEGLELLDKALVVVDRSGERSWEAEVHRLKGELLLRQADRSGVWSAAIGEAEAWLHQALAIARRQEAKALELRAAMSLARWWQQQGKHREARELLVPIYGWFTEGVDTADLQEARALLAAL
jgi:predicted ATPase/class 3 adenylate cyclase